MGKPKFRKGKASHKRKPSIPAPNPTKPTANELLYEDLTPPITPLIDALSLEEAKSPDAVMVEVNSQPATESALADLNNNLETGPFHSERATSPFETGPFPESDSEGKRQAAIDAGFPIAALKVPKNALSRKVFNGRVTIKKFQQNGRYQARPQADHSGGFPSKPPPPPKKNNRGKQNRRSQSYRFDGAPLAQSPPRTTAQSGWQKIRADLDKLSTIIDASLQYYRNNLAQTSHQSNNKRPVPLNQIRVKTPPRFRKNRNRLNQCLYGQPAGPSAFRRQ